LLKNTFILGMPLQFISVVLVAGLLVIYVLAISASTRIEKRKDARYEIGQTEIYTWESAAIWMCPLH
jgi:NADH:ubiquinone oxidoreductase subunit 3 (subunit A)